MQRATAIGLVMLGASAVAFGCHLVDPIDDLTSGTSDGGARPDGAVDASPDVVFDAGACDANVANDPNHCGRCGRSCFGEACEAGVCRKHFLAQKGVADIAYADGVVYFAAGSGDAGEIGAYTLANEQLTTVTSGRVGVNALAVKPPYVYWTEDGSIARALVDGGAVAPIVTTGLAGGAVDSLAANATFVYYPNGNASALERAPAGGGSPAPVSGIAFAPYGVRASDAVLAYNGPNSLFQLDLSTTGTTSVADVGNFQGLIAITSANVYFAEGADVYQVGIGKGQRTKIGSVPPGAGVTSVGADDTGVYWGSDKGGIYGCDDPLCKAGAHFVTATASNPHHLAVAPDSVFFNEPSSVALFRAAR